jgi:hypothetical protein
MDKDIEKNSIKANCCLKLIKKSNSEKWIKAVALWHFFKATYGNSVLFSYRSRMQEISLKFGVCTKSLYKYISILKKNGLAFDFNNNLNLVSIKFIKKQYSDRKKSQITINCQTDELWHIQCRLYAKFIESKFKKIAFMEALARFGKHDRHKTESCENVFLPSFSIRNAAKLLGIGKDSVIKVFKTLELLEILAIYKPQILKISNERLPVEILKDFPGYLFETENGTFQIFGNTIELKQYPVILPKIKPKVYAKYYNSA